MDPVGSGGISASIPDAGRLDLVVDAHGDDTQEAVAEHPGSEPQSTNISMITFFIFFISFSFIVPNLFVALFLSITLI